MNDIKYLRENVEEVKQNIQNQNIDPSLLDELLALDEKRRSLIKEVDELRQALNKGSKDESNREKLREVALKEKGLRVELVMLTQRCDEILRQIPNLYSKETPEGKDDTANVVLSKTSKPILESGESHEVIMTKLGLLDIPRAVKVSGSRFYFLLNEAVELEFALVRFAMDRAKAKGFQPILPPVLMQREIGIKAGHPEVDSLEAYQTKQDDLYLIGSSEHSIMAMHSDEILELKDLPKRFLGFSTCFRREAGSYGKDVKGILRTHQFDKLELVTLCEPENSPQEQQLMLELAQDLLKELELPFQTVAIASGDKSHAAVYQMDLETWIPSQQKYRETHSCSNCTDYQSRALNIRYKDKQGQVRFVHGLNGTALAIGRILIALVENHYDAKSNSVRLPAVLKPYLSFSKISAKE